MRRAVIIVSAVVVLILVLAAAGPRLIPSATYKGIIEQALRERLNARVEIEGFAFRVIPYPGYTIRGFRLISDAQPFQGMTLLHAEKVVGSLSFPALLRGKIVTGIELRDAQLDIRFAQGLSNLGAMLRIEGLAPGEARPVQAAPEIRPIGVQAPAPYAPEAPPPGSTPEFRSMPAPSIEPPAGAEEIPAEPEIKPIAPSSGILPFDLVRDALAADPSSGGLSFRIQRVDAIRSRILIEAESIPRPVVVSGASFSLREIAADGGLSMQLKLTGAVGESSSPNLSVSCRLAVDEARREVKASGLGIYFNGSQFSGEASVNYGFTPASFEVRLASPDLAPLSAGAMMAHLGRDLPPALSWQGRLGAAAAYRGTASAGELSLSIDARDARIDAGAAFKKEQGSPLKIAIDSTLSDAALAISKGSVVIGSSEFSVTGEIRRDEELSATLELNGSGLGADAARLVMPGLATMADVGEFSAEVRISAALAGPLPAKISGRIESPRASAAGIEIEQAGFSFEREAEAVSVVSLKGLYAGGEVSGAGRFVTAGRPSMEFEVVAHDVDASAVKSAGGLLSGKAELVARVKSDGADAYSLQNNLVVSGTIVMPQFRGPAAEAAPDLIAAPLVDAISAASGVKLDSAALAGPAAGEAVAMELRSSFEIAGGLLSIQGAAFKGSGFAARLSAGAQPDSSLKGEGELEMEAGVAKRIAPDPTAQRALLEKDGRLIVPVEVMGTVSRPKLVFSEAKFAEMMQAGQRIKAQEDAAEAAKKEEAAKQEKAKPKPKPAQPSGQAQAPKKKAAEGKPSPTAPIDDVEQLLKVIVGE